MNAAPTLIHASVTQLPYIPMLNRYLSIEECLKLQGLREIITKIRNNSWEKSYTAIGNAVNADVVEKIAITFLSNNINKNKYRIKPIQRNLNFYN